MFQDIQSFAGSTYDILYMLGKREVVIESDAWVLEKPHPFDFGVINCVVV